MWSSILALLSFRQQWSSQSQMSDKQFEPELAGEKAFRSAEVGLGGISIT